MKFLCLPCDEVMVFAERQLPGDGTFTAVFTCPDCNREMAMLANPMETQMVESLGVKIGASAAEGDSAKCPFGDVVREMGAESDAGSVPWTREALTRLDNIPDFVRPMARQGIEHYARSQGYNEVDESVLEEARGQFGM